MLTATRPPESAALDIPLILRTLDLRRIYTSGRYDFPCRIAGELVYVPCPFHRDGDNPNMFVNECSTYCFACGDKGKESAKAHIARVFGLTGLDIWRKAREFCVPVERAAGSHADGPAPLFDTAPATHARKLRELQTQATPDGPPGPVDYLRARYGLNLDTIAANHIGHTGRAYSIPVYNLAGELVNIRFRADAFRFPDAPFPFWGIKGHNAPVWYIPPALLAYQGGTLAECIQAANRARFPGNRGKWNSVILTEGELDALAGVQGGLTTISGTDGARAFTGKHSVSLEALAGLTVYVAFDMDETGWDAATAILGKLAGLGIPAYRLAWTEPYKDASELLAAGRNLRRTMHIVSCILPNQQHLV